MLRVASRGQSCVPRVMLDQDVDQSQKTHPKGRFFKAFEYIIVTGCGTYSSAIR